MGVGDREELMHVQALIPQAPIEGLDVAVIRELTGSSEVELDAAVKQTLIAATTLRPVNEIPPLGSDSHDSTDRRS